MRGADVVYESPDLNDLDRINMENLFRAHWNEAAVPLLMKDAEFFFDWEWHARAQKLGLWTCFAAREGCSAEIRKGRERGAGGIGGIAGYASFFVSRHPFIDERTAQMESFYVVPACRDGFAGVRLLRFAAESLKKQGVRAVHLGAPFYGRCGGLFRRLGAQPLETVWRLDMQTV